MVQLALETISFQSRFVEGLALRSLLDATSIRCLNNNLLHKVSQIICQHLINPISSVARSQQSGEEHSCCKQGCVEGLLCVLAGNQRETAMSRILMSAGKSATQAGKSMIQAAAAGAAATLVTGCHPQVHLLSPAPAQAHPQHGTRAGRAQQESAADQPKLTAAGQFKQAAAVDYQVKLLAGGRLATRCISG